jgi:hypothetical protein
MEDRLVEWQVLSSAPRPGQPASLREAWGLSTGRAWLDKALDVSVVPVIETVLFLGLLGIGLWTGNLLLIVLGLAIKTHAFPALHHLLPEKSAGRDLAADRHFAGVLAILYLVTWAALSFMGVPANAVFWLAMVPPLVAHVKNNVDFHFGSNKTVASRGINTIDGASPAAVIDAARPRVAPVRLPRLRATRQTA